MARVKAIDKHATHWFDHIYHVTHIYTDRGYSWAGLIARNDLFSFLVNHIHRLEFDTLESAQEVWEQCVRAND